MQWKTAEVIMNPTPSKNISEMESSYRPISILLIMSMLFEKLIFKRLKLLTEEKHLVSRHQFGFRESHSTIDQAHRITDTIDKTPESKGVCSAAFLDIAQVFDRARHRGVLHKPRSILSDHFYQLLKPYLANRNFSVKHEGKYTELKLIKAGATQRSVLGPALYLLYINDVPTILNNTIATFSDDTEAMAAGEILENSLRKLQSTVNKVVTWTKVKWRITLNESKSVHIIFKNKKIRQQLIFSKGIKVLYASTAQYLGMTRDVKLRWKGHIKKKNVMS
jgi:hypothetical protein